MWSKMQGQADKDADQQVTRQEWAMFVQNVASLGKIDTLRKQYEQAAMSEALNADLARVKLSRPRPGETDL